MRKPSADSIHVVDDSKRFGPILDRIAIGGMAPLDTLMSRKLECLELS